MAKGEGFQFFGRVWRADIEVHACPLEARGFWIELLMVMDEASPRGCLLVNGVQPTLAQMAQLASCTPAEARRCLDLLLRFGAAGRGEDGVLFSRRMVAESEKSAKARASVGKRWQADGGGGGTTDRHTKADTNEPTKPDTNVDTKGPTKPDTKADTKADTKSPFPLHPLSPSESLLESSSSASTSIRKRLRARGRSGAGLQENQVVSGLRQAGYRIENGGENGLKIGLENGQKIALENGAKPIKKADQTWAYKRVQELLQTHYGRDAAATTLILLAAYSPEMDGHGEAKAFVERVSREHGCGLYPDRPLLPNARHGVRA